MWWRLARKEADEEGTRKKGSMCVQGIDLVIEYPKGSVREKKNSEGKTWQQTMQADYGRLSKTEGADGDCIDVFLGPDLGSDKAFVLNQVNEEGVFDEHKTILGCHTVEEARKLYLSSYPKNWKCGKIKSFTIAEFKKWLRDGDKDKPA